MGLIIKLVKSECPLYSAITCCNLHNMVVVAMVNRCDVACCNLVIFSYFCLCYWINQWVTVNTNFPSETKTNTTITPKSVSVFTSSTHHPYRARVVHIFARGWLWLAARSYCSLYLMPARYYANWLYRGVSRNPPHMFNYWILNYFCFEMR